MGKQILIVEDDPDIRMLTVLILKPAGYDVLEAGSGEDGLRLLDEHPVDLLIQDIMLPGINGWEVCRRLRADPKTATLPILIFTVRGKRHDLDAHALADGFVNKPFDSQDLLAAVQQCISACEPRGKEPQTV